jgi:hypothetical protein
MAKKKRKAPARIYIAPAHHGQRAFVCCLKVLRIDLGPNQFSVREFKGNSILHG